MTRKATLYVKLSAHIHRDLRPWTQWHTPVEPSRKLVVIELARNDPVRGCRRFEPAHERGYGIEVVGPGAAAAVVRAGWGACVRQRRKPGVLKERESRDAPGDVEQSEPLVDGAAQRGLDAGVVIQGEFLGVYGVRQRLQLFGSGQ